MKKLTLSALLAAICFITSCTKENPTNNWSEDNTTSISEEVLDKTCINTRRGLDRYLLNPAIQGTSTLAIYRGTSMSSPFSFKLNLGYSSVQIDRLSFIYNDNKYSSPVIPDFYNNSVLPGTYIFYKSTIDGTRWLGNVNLYVVSTSISPVTFQGRCTNKLTFKFKINNSATITKIGYLDNL